MKGANLLINKVENGYTIGVNGYHKVEKSWKLKDGGESHRCQDIFYNKSYVLDTLDSPSLGELFNGWMKEADNYLNAEEKRILGTKVNTSKPVKSVKKVK